MNNAHTGQITAATLAARAFVRLNPTFDDSLNLWEFFDNQKGFEEASEPIFDYMEMEHPIAFRQIFSKVKRGYKH